LEIIKTKLLPPRLKPGMVVREICANPSEPIRNKKAVLITAPAGYGKTTIMLQLLHQYKQPFVWYQLDTYDNDPAVFLQYITAGFQQYLPQFGKEAVTIINQGDFPNNLRLVLGVFINSLVQSKEKFILVLDDYQVISEPVIHRFIQEFLERLPENTQLFIASRTTLPLSLSRLTAVGEISIIDSNELRFNRDEIKEYLASCRQDPDDSLIDYIESNTNGWPVALGLTKAFMVVSQTNTLSLGTEEIYTYLAGEVLAYQSEAIREFLIATSVLDELTPEYCDLLLERSDSTEILRYLEKQQLFLTVLEGKTSTYRYHHLFREFLRSRLGNKRPDLMRRAGLIACESGEFDRAIANFILAGLDVEAIATIEEAAKPSLQQGRWLTVSRWLDSLSSKIIAANSWLSLYQAQVELYRNRFGEVEKWAEIALTLFKKNGDQAGLAESRLIQARILRHRGKYRESLKLLEAAETYLAKMGLRVDLPLEKSILLYFTGRHKEAESLLLETLKRAEQFGDGDMIANLLEGLGNIYYIQGDYQKALGIYKKGIQVSPERILPGYYAQDFIALIHLDWGEVEPALEYAKRNVTIRENLGMKEALPSAYMHLAFLYVDNGEVELAEDYYRRAYELNRENQGDSFYLTINLIFWARSLALLHRFSEARLKVEEALRVAGQEPSLALANCLTVAGIVLLLIGDLPKAEEMLRQGTAVMEQIGFRKGICFAYEFSAALYFTTNKMELAGEYAHKALESAARLNDLQVFITFYETLKPILKYGLVNGVEVSFINRVLSRLGPTAAELLTELADHPDPEARRRAIVPLAELGEGTGREILRRLAKDPAVQVAELARSVSLRMGFSGVKDEEQRDLPALLRINGLGPLQILLGGQDITAINWRTEKARDLLIYLAHFKEPVSKERIIEDLWPDQEEQILSYNLHSTVYRLRKVLEKYKPGETLLLGGSRYQVKADFYETDWYRFEGLCSALSADSFDLLKKINLLEEALSLYRGDYLEELDYQWLLPYRQRYKNLYLQTGVNLARLYIEAKEFQKAINLVDRLMETDSFLEEAHVLALTAYIGMGDRVGAIRYYQKIAELFQLELGLSPPAEAVELYQKVVGS